LGSVDSSFSFVSADSIQQLTDSSFLFFGFVLFLFCFCFVSAAADSRQQTTDNKQQTTDNKQQIADSRIVVIRRKRKDGWRSESSGNDL
jgi:hypothetical protein